MPPSCFASETADRSYTNCEIGPLTVGSIKSPRRKADAYRVGGQGTSKLQLLGRWRSLKAGGFRSQMLRRGLRWNGFGAGGGEMEADKPFAGSAVAADFG